jgi:hypothetical protein
MSWGGNMHPADKKNSFTAELYSLLESQGWYKNNGWREHSDRDRGYRTGLSEGQVVDELLRRDWQNIGNEGRMT